MKVHPQNRKQGMPKGAEENGVPVSDSTPRKPMEFVDIVQISLSHYFYNIRVSEGRKMGIFAESATNNQDYFLSLKLGQSFYEVHRNVYPHIFWNG